MCLPGGGPSVSAVVTSVSLSPFLPISSCSLALKGNYTSHTPGAHGPERLSGEMFMSRTTWQAVSSKATTRVEF